MATLEPQTTVTAADATKFAGAFVPHSLDGSGLAVPQSSAAPAPVVGGTDYETVAASTTSVLGATGAIGDRLDILWIVPATTSPGAIQIKDGGGSAITVFAGGAGSVLDLRPQPVVLGIKCTGAGWSVITGANVSTIGCGKFT